MKVFLTSWFSVLWLDVRNHSNKKGEKFSCFRLPGHAHLRNVWLAKLKRENLPNERSIPFTKPCIDPPGKLFICCIAI